MEGHLISVMTKLAPKSGHGPQNPAWHPGIGNSLPPPHAGCVGMHPVVWCLHLKFSGKSTCRDPRKLGAWECWSSSSKGVLCIPHKGLPYSTLELRSQCGYLSASRTGFPTSVPQLGELRARREVACPQVQFWPLDTHFFMGESPCQPYRCLPNWALAQSL